MYFGTKLHGFFQSLDIGDGLSLIMSRKSCAECFTGTSFIQWALLISSFPMPWIGRDMRVGWFFRYSFGIKVTR